MQDGLDPIIYVIWGVTLLLVAFMAYQRGISRGIRFCQGKAKQLCDAAQRGQAFDPRKPNG